MVPGAAALKMVSGLPSPQLTSTVHGPPSGSVNEPRSNEWTPPSIDFWLAGAVTVGGGLTVSSSQPPRPIVPAPTRLRPGIKSRSVTLVLGRLAKRVQVVPRSVDPKA